MTTGRGAAGRGAAGRGAIGRRGTGLDTAPSAGGGAAGTGMSGVPVLAPFCCDFLTNSILNSGPGSGTDTKSMGPVVWKYFAGPNTGASPFTVLLVLAPDEVAGPAPAGAEDLAAEGAGGPAIAGGGLAVDGEEVPVAAGVGLAEDGEGVPVAAGVGLAEDDGGAAGRGVDEARLK